MALAIAFGSKGDALPPNENFIQPESTARMAQRIGKIYQEADPRRNTARSSDIIPILRKAEMTEVEPKTLFEIKVRLGTELLQAGDTEAALAKYTEAEELLLVHTKPINPNLQLSLWTQKALCHLRAGEQANCLANHNRDSCLFPIQGGGVHQLTEGSRGAVAVLTELLRKSPKNLRARWLLNIAYMTLGEYPTHVPPQWLIGPEHFASDREFPRFEDVAPAVGLDHDSLAGGVVAEDFDHDGFLDLMISSWGFRAQDQLRVFRNNGDGTFQDRTDKAGLRGLVSGLNLIQGDYDNDGYADVLVLRGAWLNTEGHYPLSLLRNNGDFTFTDVTEEAGITHLAPSQAATWFDFNGDGFLDIFVGNESVGNDFNPCELYRNNGDGTFTECAASCGVNFTGYYKGVTSGDYNNDGRPDLFLSNRNGPKVLLRNDGPANSYHPGDGAWNFSDVTTEAGIVGPAHTFPCWFWDYNNDGWLDLMFTGYGIKDVGDIAADVLGQPTTGAKATLYRNNGDGTFTDVSVEAGVSQVLHTMGVNFGDLDNDGWLDLYLGTGDPDFATLIPNRMFRNDHGERFQDLTTAGGFGQLQKGHGIAFADIDNDGDQDIYSVVGGAVEADHYSNQLFANPGFGHHWLKLQLEGRRSNRVAIGARIQVTIEEAGSERCIHRVVGTGASFGANPLRQEIGLGSATRIKRVDIVWPTSGTRQVFEGIELDKLYQIREDRAEAELRPLSPFTFPSGMAGGHSHHHH